MSSITIDFSAGLGKWRRAIVLTSLTASLVAVILSVILLIFGSVKLGDYFMVRSDNQEALESVKLDYAQLSGVVSNTMQSLPSASVSSAQSACAQPLLHMAVIEAQLPKSAAINRFDFTAATGAITVLISGSSTDALASFIQGIESSGRYHDVSIKQKTVSRSKQYEVQYRCR
jgi:Na+/proline symporter